MDVRQLLVVLRRRWWMAALLVVATLTTAVVVSSGLPVDHIAEGRVILAPPIAVDAEGVPSNPLTGGGGLGQVGDVVAQVINDPQSHAKLEKEGASPYNVAVPPGSVAPLLAVAATAPTSEQAVATVALVSDAISEVLEEQQTLAGADPRTFVTARPLLADQEARPVSEGRTRTRVGIILGGLAVGLTAIVLLDGGLRRGRQPAAGALEPDDIALAAPLPQPSLGRSTSSGAIESTSPRVWLVANVDEAELSLPRTGTVAPPDGPPAEGRGG